MDGRILHYLKFTWAACRFTALRSRFAAVRVRPSGKAVERPIKAAASSEQGWWDGVLPDCWLLVARLPSLGG
ncbi:transposase [Streptomyces hygroscopicus]|nr:transposase [Streptomyces hygroscopicus]